MKYQISLFGLSLIALVTACGLGNQEPASPSTLTIDGQDTLYMPDTLEVVVGQPVMLTFRNTGELEHDLSFDDLPIAEGQVVLVGTANLEHDMERMTQDGHGHDEGSEQQEGSEHEADHEHDMSHDAALHMHALSGEQLSVTFTPTEPGTYEFYCTVPGHRDAGMVGTLVVIAP